ncbi:IS1 family transposase [Candidatus Enterovibrio altilux]
MYTQRIEKDNLILCVRLLRLNRKTILHSKLIENYDKIIGTFINLVYYL